MKDQKKAEHVAADRVQLLAPLLTEGLDPAKAREIKQRSVNKSAYRRGRSDGIWLPTGKMVLAG